MRKLILSILILTAALTDAAGQTVAFIGDVHVEDSVQFVYFQRTVLDALIGEGFDKNGKCVWLGDIVNESPEWIPAVAEGIGLFDSHVVMGNHDFDKRGRKGGNSLWSKSFGPDNYKFDVGKWTFVAVNNGHDTYMPEAFDLVRSVPSGRNIVLCQHEPIGDTDNGAKMLEILNKRRGQTLIMSAHQHIVRKRRLTEKVAEVIVGSVCTNWWRGVPAWDGIPYAPAQCGSPRNYFLLHLKGKRYSWDFKPIATSDNQMRIWIAGENADDKKVEGLKDYPRGTLLVNIFAGADDAQVTLSIDGGTPMLLERSKATDPSVLRLRDAVDKAKYKRKDPRRTVHLKAASPHIWEYHLPALPSGPHILTIHATDSFGLDVSSQYTFIGRAR